MTTMTTTKPVLPGTTPTFSDAESRRKFQTIMAWDMTRVKEYLVNHHQMEPGFVDQLIREYRRFMILTVLYPDLVIPIAGKVDEVWHTHILFTRDYWKFSMTVAGGYIHHNPTVSQGEADELYGAYRDNTIRLYKEMFGELDPGLWGERAQVCGCNGSWGNDHHQPEIVMNVCDGGPDIPPSHHRPPGAQNVDFGGPRRPD